MIVALFLSLFFIFCNILSQDRLAFCGNPIAEIVNSPLGIGHSNYDHVKAAYEALPISWGSDVRSKEACPRIYQLLLHELAVILEETDYEYLVAIPTAVTATQAGQIEPVQGWTLKTNLWDISQYGFDPESYDLLLPIGSNKSREVLFLVSPFLDNDGSFYSAGTKFYVAQVLNTDYIVYAFDAALGHFKKITIPQILCSYQPQTFPDHQKREPFCDLVTMWATVTPQACIPLVWGGCSIGKVWDHDDYYKSLRTLDDGSTVAVWDRPKYGDDYYMGLDASSIILRAAQIVDIPYPWRNSTTALLMLEHTNQPSDGDLLWVPGGLCIINNMAQNTIITVMSYTSGYGCLVQLPLHQAFKDIATYQDLIDAYQNGYPLTLLNHDGSIARSVENYAFLKLPV
jgi:hypothetical protein